MRYFFDQPGRVNFWYDVDTNLFRLGYSIQKRAWSRGAAPVGTGRGPSPRQQKKSSETWALSQLKSSRHSPPPSPQL